MNDLRQRATELERQIEELAATGEQHKAAAASAYENGDTREADRLIGKVSEATARSEAMTTALASLRERIREADREAAEKRRREQAEKTVDEAIRVARAVRADLKPLLESWNKVIGHEVSPRAQDVLGVTNVAATLLRIVDGHTSLKIPRDQMGFTFRVKPIDIEETLSKIDSRIGQDREKLIAQAMKDLTVFGGTK